MQEIRVTKYFSEQVLRKRPYLKLEWCKRVLLNPMRREVQLDGRVRYWGKISEFENRVLRVVTLPDGITIHNAFFDRNFKDERNNI